MFVNYSSTYPFNMSPFWNTSELPPPTMKMAPVLSQVEIIVFTMAFTVIGFVGIIGNSLVILAVACDTKMRRSAMNVLLLNLAITDCCNLIACIPEIALILLERGWILPSYLCPILRYLEVLFIYTSVLTQVAVCIERFFAIAIPMKIKLLCSRKKVQIWALVLWIIAILASMPYMIYSRTTGLICKNELALNPAIYKPWKWMEFFLFYFLPLIIIVVLYTRISLILWSTNSRLHEGCHINDRTATVNETLRTRQNVVKMLIGCIFVYFVCYSPIHALFIFHSIYTEIRLNLPYALRLLLNLMAYGCSAANPLMYSIFSRKFRAKFADILKCARNKDSSGRHPTTMYGPSIASRYVAVSDGDFNERERIVTTTRLMAKKRTSTIADALEQTFE